MQSPSPCGRGQGRQSGHGAHKRGLNSKIHLAVDAHGMPVRVDVTAGTQAECTAAVARSEGRYATFVVAGSGYSSL